MKNWRMLFPALLAASGAAHAVALVEPAKSARQAQSAGDPVGCVVGSVGRLAHPPTDKVQGSVSLRILRAGLEPKASNYSLVRYSFRRPGKKGNDFSDSHSFGSVFMLCLEPGDYGIPTIENLDGVTFFNSEPFDIPFTVVAGQTRYIGAFLLHRSTEPSDCLTDERRIFADRDYQPRQAFTAIVDKSERDLPLIMAKAPPFLPISVDVVTPRALYSLVARCPP